MESKSVTEENNHNPYKLLDLISNNGTNKNREWLLPSNNNNLAGISSTQNKPHLLRSDQKTNNLELSLGLGLPGGDQTKTHEEHQMKNNWLQNKTPERDGAFNHTSAYNYHHHQSHSHSPLVVTHYCNSCNQINCICRHHNHSNLFTSFPTSAAGTLPPLWTPGSSSHSKDGTQQQPPTTTSSRMITEELTDKKNKYVTFHLTPPIPNKNSTSKAAAAPPLPPPNTSQKRAAPGLVVGWPPIRSFRKNLASTSNNNNINNTEANNSKSEKNHQNGYPNSNPSSSRPAAIENKKKPPVVTHQKGQFVKINMDGVAIGRKVDLSNFDSYEKLSFSVDPLFRDLRAAQMLKKEGEEPVEPKPITGLLDGNGEYTLVYEDNEGDRILVGDVPWHMFLSTVKRLRVLKSSELKKLSKGNNGKEGKKVAITATR